MRTADEITQHRSILTRVGPKDGATNLPPPVCIAWPYHLVNARIATSRTKHDTALRTAGCGRDMTVVVVRSSPRQERREPSPDKPRAISRKSRQWAVGFGRRPADELERLLEARQAI